jgi:hypothetical protein
MCMKRKMFMDGWISNSKPIDIPIKKNMKVALMTNSCDVQVCISSINGDLVSGYLAETPPKPKHYVRGDKIIFHACNIFDVRS